MRNACDAGTRRAAHRARRGALVADLRPPRRWGMWRWRRGGRGVGQVMSDFVESNPHSGGRNRAGFSWPTRRGGSLLFSAAGGRDGERWWFTPGRGACTGARTVQGAPRCGNSSRRPVYRRHRGASSGRSWRRPPLACGWAEAEGEAVPRRAHSFFFLRVQLAKLNTDGQEGPWSAR